MIQRLAKRQVAKSDFERRYLTIGFVDIVGATSLSERLDPEELKDIYARVRQLCSDSVSKMQGHVVAPAGDGIMFEFGYPRARENDSERALAAALAIIQQLKELDFGARLGGKGCIQARIGVCSGLVLVGLETGTSWTIFNSIVGEAANVAHRLQALAEPNQIIVAQETIDSVRNLFDVLPLGPLSITGLTRPVNAYRLLQRSYRGKRGPRGLHRTMAPLVGRDLHLREIRTIWDAAQAKRSLRIIEVVGDAGIGKSRLINEFTRCVIPDDRVISLHCFDALASTPLHPFTNLLLARAGAVPGETDLARLDRVSAYLAGLTGMPRHDPQIVASVLGLPVETCGSAPITPRQRKRGEFALLADFVTRLCSVQPSALVFEDVHWLDPSSKELLPQIFERLAHERILVLIASRLNTFGSLQGVSSIVLEPLSQDDSLQIARFISREQALSGDTLREVVRACDGIPFFIEQVVVSHAATSTLQNAAAVDRSKDVRNGLTLPLAELLFDRLDRFPGAKKLMRVISAFSQPANRETIAAVLGTPAAKLTTNLDLLVQERILECPAAMPPHAGLGSPGLTVEYSFRHALLQRACYDSMVSATREDLHRRIVEVLRSHAASGGSVPTSIVAHHLLSGGLFNEAALAWLKGGMESAMRSANAEAVDHLTKARTAAAKIADPATAAALKLKIMAAFIGPLVAVRGFSSPEVLECCQEGLDLCPPSDKAAVFPFMYGRFTSEISSGQVRNALASAEIFEALSRKHGYEPGEVISGRLSAMALFTLGRPVEAEAAVRGSIAAYQPHRDESIAFLYGANSKVTGQSLLSLILFYRGKTEEAAELGSRTLKDADEIRHPLSTGIALAYIGAFIPAYCDLTDVVQTHAEHMYALSIEHNLNIFAEYGRFFTAWAGHQRRKDASTIDAMWAAVHQLESLSWRLTLPSILALLADAYVQSGRFADAQATCERARIIIGRGGDRWGLSEVLRVQALAAAGQQASPEHITALSQGALAAARENATPLFEARAIRTALELSQQPKAEIDSLRQQYAALAKFTPDATAMARLLKR